MAGAVVITPQQGRERGTKKRQLPVLTIRFVSFALDFFVCRRETNDVVRPETGEVKKYGLILF